MKLDPKLFGFPRGLSPRGNDYMADLARVHVALRKWRPAEMWEERQIAAIGEKSGEDSS